MTDKPTDIELAVLFAICGCSEEEWEHRGTGATVDECRPAKRAIAAHTEALKAAGMVIVARVPSPAMIFAGLFYTEDPYQTWLDMVKMHDEDIKAHEAEQ